MKKFNAFLYILFLYLTSSAQIDWEKPFRECRLEGSITIYDYKNKKWFYSDKDDAKRLMLPASSFKFLNSLILLETGAVKDENEIEKWDGTEREVKSWNADTDMKKAFKNSAGWFYVKRAAFVGKAKYKDFLDNSDYGNGKIYGGLGNDFWNYGEFGVSPVEQVKMLVNLYEEKLPFSKRNFEIVKRISIAEKTDKYTLRAKTGWTREIRSENDQSWIGWWIGYYEMPENAYFFATRVTKEITPKTAALFSRSEESRQFSSCRKDITNQILRELKFIEN